MSIQLSDNQPQKCPNCGAKVSAHARTCLICGANLRAQAAPPAPAVQLGPPRRGLPWRLAGLAAGIVVLLLAAGALLMRPKATVALVTPTQTATPTEELTPTVSPTPTAQPPTATATASPAAAQPSTPVPPTRYTVRSGDTLLSIASKFGTTVDVLESFNGLVDTDLLQVGQVLQIPSANATPGPTLTAQPTATFIPGPTPGTVLHVVQTGDTLLGIALKYGVPMTIIQKANDIEDPESIKAGQQLVIPIGPTATPTSGPTPTPTGLPTYPAPIPLSPVEGQVFEGAQPSILLQWASVGILRENEWYMVHVEQVDGTLVLQPQRTQATAYLLPQDLFPKPDDPHRTFRWYVWVVRDLGARGEGTSPYVKAGLASSPRTFKWVMPQPTPTPTPGPTS